MRLVALDPADLVVSDELSRSGSTKQFEERLKSSIEEIGLAEPIKVASLPTGKYLVVDGIMRLRAIAAIRKADPSRFQAISAYVTDYENRFEIRYQTDIYQDLLPSQLASLVEHLHKTERIKKADIARYIGVSPVTLRNYTGLWRLLQRGDLFAKIVDLMDVGVIPSSNPYAWLRLTPEGLERVLLDSFSYGEPVEPWIQERIIGARQGQTLRFTTTYVESATNSLEPKFYRVDEELRTIKRDLGLRRAAAQQLFEEPPKAKPKRDVSAAVRHLSLITRDSPEPVLQTAARSLRKYLQ